MHRLLSGEGPYIGQHRYEILPSICQLSCGQRFFWGVGSVLNTCIKESEYFLFLNVVENASLEFR